MMKWLWQLIWPKDCEHDWELLQKINISWNVGDPIYGTKWLYRCTKCGKQKKYET